MPTHVPTWHTSAAISNSLVQYLLNHAANTPPKIEAMTGNRILSHGRLYYIIGIASLCIALMMYVISFSASPWDTIRDTIIFSGFMGLFVIAGILILLSAVISRVIVSDNGIIVKTPWYRREVNWEDISSITYSGLAESLVVTSKDKTMVRVYPGYNGIMYLVRCFEEHLKPEVFSDDVKGVIKSTKSRVKDSSTYSSSDEV